MSTILAILCSGLSLIMSVNLMSLDAREAIDITERTKAVVIVRIRFILILSLQFGMHQAYRRGCAVCSDIFYRKDKLHIAPSLRVNFMSYEQKSVFWCD